MARALPSNPERWREGQWVHTGQCPGAWGEGIGLHQGPCPASPTSSLSSLLPAFPLPSQPGPPGLGEWPAPRCAMAPGTQAVLPSILPRRVHTLGVSSCWRMPVHLRGAGLTAACGGPAAPAAGAQPRPSAAFVPAPPSGACGLRAWLWPGVAQSCARNARPCEKKPAAPVSAQTFRPWGSLVAGRGRSTQPTGTLWGSQSFC